METHIKKQSSWRLLFSGTLPFFVLAHFFHHFVTEPTAPLLPLIRNEFSLSYTQAGLINSLFTIAGGIGHLIVGWLSYHVKLRILILVGTSGMAMVFLLTGFAPNYAILLILITIVGLLSAGYHPAALPLIANSVGKNNQSTAFGLHSVGSGVCFFLVPLVVAAVSVYWGWRGTYITMSIPTIIYGLFLYHRLGKPQKKIEDNYSVNNEAEHFAPPPRYQTIALITMAISIGSLLMPLLTFIPLYLVDHFSISAQSAAAMSSTVFIAGIFGGPLGGYLADRLGTKRVLLTTCFLTGPAIYLLTTAKLGIPIIVALLFMGIVSFVRIPLSESYLVISTPPRHRTMIISTVFFASLVVSGILGPIIGKTVDNYGFYIMLTGSAVIALVISIICALIALKK